jgi:glycosyltransferase involved in cell wall biosynthesis
MKRVTVVIPAYGVEKYIAATIQSVLAQTYQNFELLVIDDGSPDRSVEICQQFTDPRIKILHQENSGPAAARNLGIRHATGDYIAFLDGDDLWLPEKLAKHVEHLDNAPQVGVSFCRSALIDEDDNPLGIYQAITKLQGITLLDLLCRTPIGNGSVPVMRRELFDDMQYLANVGDRQEVSYFNPDRSVHPSEEVECWVRIATTTRWAIEGIPDALTLYRVNSRGFSANLLKKLHSWERMLEAARTYAPEQIKPCEAAAMAYQYRHLARRAVTLRDGKMAVQLINKALMIYPQLLVEETSRTGQTVAAAYLMRLLPASLYQQFEAKALQAAGAAQKQRIAKDQKTPAEMALKR